MLTTSSALEPGEYAVAKRKASIRSASSLSFSLNNVFSMLGSFKFRVSFASLSRSERSAPYVLSRYRLSLDRFADLMLIS